MKVWLMLFVAGLINYGLRVFPLIFKHIKFPSKNDKFFRFMDYVVCSILGCIIYINAFHSQDYQALYANFDKIDFLKIVTLVGVFCLSCRHKNILHNFLLFFSSFAVLSWFMI